jgi:hypothetical protein
VKQPKSLKGLFSLPGFAAEARLLGVFGDRYARIVVLRRRKKRQCARAVGIDAVDDTTSVRAEFEICRLLVGGSICSSSVGGSTALGVAPCS